MTNTTTACLLILFQTAPHDPEPWVLAEYLVKEDGTNVTTIISRFPTEAAARAHLQMLAEVMQ